jgi:adenosine deaminase
MISTDLPLIDLHRHVEGNLRISTIIDLARQHNIPLPAWEIEDLRPYVQVQTQQPGVMAFLEKFALPMRVLADLDACRRVVYEAVLDAHAEGIDYIELRFSPWFMAETHALPAQGVVGSPFNDGYFVAVVQRYFFHFCRLCCLICFP